MTDHLIEAHHDDKPDYPSDDALKVHVCNLKKKLAPLGLHIACVWGEGYILFDEALDDA